METPISFVCQSTLHSPANVSNIDFFFSNRNLKNLLLEGNTIESLPLELGQYVLESVTLFQTYNNGLNLGVN